MTLAQAIVFGFLAFVSLMIYQESNRPEILVFTFFAVTVWTLVPKILEHIKTPKAEKQPDKNYDFLKERLENLEGLLCRLDSEINMQLERSLSAGKLILSQPPAGVSQMPTIFNNVATALEQRFQVLNEIGRGGMGIVFQAYDKQLKENVAIKILSPLLSQDQEALERLKREVAAARRVTHASVIRIHDLSEMNGLHFVSMEYFPGISLREFIRLNGAQSLMQGYQVAAQICDGLEAAHRQGVIHRDLKSHNVIVSSSGQVKIIDFGLAHSTHMDGMTATGLILGTPEYMAPEQVAGKRVDERADVYALGIILYEIFTGRVPFTGESPIAVGFRQLKEDPMPPCEVSPNVSPELQQVILKALQKDPAMRFRTVTELKLALEKAAQPPERAGITEKTDRYPEAIKTKT